MRIGTGDQTEAVTLLAVVRVGDDGTAAAAGPGVQSGALHLEGAPGGLHHATRLHRGGMIGFQTEHGPHAVTLTTETLGELHHLSPPLLRSTLFHLITNPDDNHHVTAKEARRFVLRLVRRTRLRQILTMAPISQKKVTIPV